MDGCIFTIGNGIKNDYMLFTGSILSINNGSGFVYAAYPKGYAIQVVLSLAFFSI